ncbi:MAG: hypothetical protein C5B43_00440 [Verrucomicrobia bacterium]|nr:MAG: hypothetical protein C5B43_00440 [Verrucomicrobiota bacterium]
MKIIKLSIHNIYDYPKTQELILKLNLYSINSKFLTSLIKNTKRIKIRNTLDFLLPKKEKKNKLNKKIITSVRGNKQNNIDI